LKINEGLVNPPLSASKSTTTVNNVSDFSVLCSCYDDDFGAFERHSKVVEARDSESM